MLISRNLLLSPLLKTFSFSVLLLLNGCFEPGQQDEVKENVMRHTQKNSNATFYLGREITGKSYDDKSLEGWSIPQAKSFNLRACLSDRVTNDRIIGHEFEIVGSQRGHLVTTDDEGCLNWDEVIDFNYFAEQAKYLTIEREIKGHGVHRGSFAFSVALNPWHSSRNSQSAEIVDLTKRSVPQSQILDSGATSHFMQAQFEQMKAVEVKGLGATISSRRAVKDGHEVDIQLNFTPQVVTKDLLGNKVIHYLKRGEFDLYFEVVGTKAINDDKSGDSVFPITDSLFASTQAKSSENSILFSDNKVDVNLETTIRDRVPNGQYQLVLRLLPKGIDSLGEFYAVYRFSEDGKLLSSKGSLRPLLTNLDQPQAIKEFDQKLLKAKNEADTKLDPDYQAQGPFKFDHMKIAFMRVMPNETSTKRSIAYRSEVCIRRSMDGRLVEHEEFVIHKSDGSKETVNTENEGCVAWIDTITHHYYRPENIMKKSIVIAHPRSGAKTELSAYLNPWDYGWTFAQDARKLSKKYIEDVNNRESISSQFFISGFSYQTIRFRYEIDKFLNLNVKKTLLLDVSPKVLRYNSITRGRNATESLRDGVYLMQVAIQKDYYDPRTPGINLKKHKSIPGRIEVESSHNAEVEYISSVQKLVRVKHGRIITPVEFSVNDLRLMRIRSNFLIQISPIDEEALGITPTTNMSNIDLSSIVAQSESLSMQERTHPRRAQENEHQTQGQYVLDNQYFTDSPYDVLDYKLAQNMKDDSRLQQKLSSSEPNFNLLIDKDAGLPTRTFVGPIILLANAFGAGLRPTDDLEEVSDCERMIGPKREQCLEDLQNSNVPDFDNDPQVAKFYGSARHLENINVQDLIKRQEKIELEYHNQQTYESLLSRYTKEFFLDFVSLEDEKLKVLPMEQEAMKIVGQDDAVTSFTDLSRQICGSDDITDCLETDERPAKTNYRKLLEYLNFEHAPWSLHNRHLVNRTPEFRKADLAEFIRKGEGDELMQQRLCHTWIYYMMSERLGQSVLERDKENPGGFLSGPGAKEAYHAAYYQCVNTKNDKLEDVFHISRKLRPKAVEGYRFRGGKSMNFNVGANFGMNFGESLGNNLSASFDPLSLLKDLGGKIGSVFGVFSVKTNWSASQSQSLGQGTSVSSGTYLAMQKASMDLYFEEYEACLEVRMTGDILNSYGMKHIFKNMDDKEAFDAASQGLFLCTGIKEKRNEPFNENYYYFTQHFTEGDMLDNGDLLNHPWLLALRGERNYAHFVNLIKATPATDKKGRDFSLKWLPNHLLKHYLNESELVSGVNDEVDLGERPLDQLIEAYNMVPPTFPGLFTIRPKKLEYPK